MINNSYNNNQGGIGFFGLLGIVFIVLKILGYIDWSWWIVLSPIWGSFLLGIIVFFLILFWKFNQKR